MFKRMLDYSAVRTLLDVILTPPRLLFDFPEGDVRAKVSVFTPVSDSLGPGGN